MNMSICVNKRQWVNILRDDQANLNSNMVKMFMWIWPNKYDDVIKWKHFPRYWPFVRGVHRSPVNSPHKGQWRGALMFSLIFACVKGWVNNREAGVLRHHCPIMTSLQRRGRFRHHWSFMRVTHLSPVDSNRKGSVLCRFDVYFVASRNKAAEKKPSICMWFERARSSCDVTITIRLYGMSVE